METGIVKWFNTMRGFGFIEQANSDIELFVHFSEINIPGSNSLYPGQRVSFTKVGGKKGFAATNIQHEIVKTDKNP